jgi:hypothetical protein
MSTEAKLCEECGQRPDTRMRKLEGKKGWCSDKCLIKAGKKPIPTPKVFKKEKTHPRQVVFRGL